MKELPNIVTLDDGSKLWSHRFEQFVATVYLPPCDLPIDIINYGFMTPYLLVFPENPVDFEAAKQLADENGLAQIAAGYGSSVVYIYPTCEGGWSNAPSDLFASVISKTKISQYYKDGTAVFRNRFTGEWGNYFIRGALNRSFLFGYGVTADFIATNCLKTVNGDGLYGYGDITPAACILQGVSVPVAPERRDIPVISIANSEETNAALLDSLDHVLIKDAPDYVGDFHAFLKKFRRMVGYLDVEPDLATMGMTVETGACVVTTSPDNRGDDCDTTEHTIGYVAYYNNGIMDTPGGVPLVMCFHGGGDSAMCMVALSDWHYVISKHNFLLVSVENHLNSTATETMALIEHIKQRYNVDSERIYATGFSMGGCKSWDLFQEYPTAFAAVAPMSATFEVGLNAYGQPAPNVNENEPLPVFYVGGEQTPLPELPFQAQKCLDRMAYVLRINKALKPYNVSFDNQDLWENPIWGIDGDLIRHERDDNRGSVLTMHLFESEGGLCYCVFGSGSPQMHEMRYLNCENAWKFFSQFRRLADGTIVGGKMEEIAALYKE